MLFQKKYLRNQEINITLDVGIPIPDISQSVTQHHFKLVYFDMFYLFDAIR
jgi:hypothetical protein